MLQGFYTAASGILQQERTLGVLTNNIMNFNTPGFRASRVVSTTFEQEYLTRIERNGTEHIGAGAPIRVVSDVPVRFTQGDLRTTERPFDLGIMGEGFFVIENEEGERYLTRNGNFDMDEEGYLILKGYGRVLGASESPIEVYNANFVVTEDGVVYTSEDGEELEEMDSILLVNTEEDNPVKLLTNGMFQAEDMDAIIPLGEGEIGVLQSNLEYSNIDIQQEYIMVMEAQRAFQACSTALQMIDSINQKAATQLASI